MKTIGLITLAILLSLNTFSAENISYSGRLVTPTGTPVVGPVNMKFDIVVDSDVKCTLNKTSVPLSNGVFNVSLDYGTTCNQFDGTLSKTIEAAYYDDKIPYIRVTDTTNTKTYPDQPIAAVPLAIHSLSGGSGNYNLDLEYTCADGEILKMNSSNQYQCSTDLEGVTGITAGAGLTGGTITSTGTINIDIGTGNGQIPQLDGSGQLAVSTIPNLPGERITSGTIDEARLPTADASNNGKITASDWDRFDKKQNALGSGSAGQYLGPGPAWATLNTQAVAEHSSNLYFTDARAKAATVADAISDGVTDVAPSQNAVFDALATKADASGDANIVADSITLDTQGAVNLEPYGAGAGNTSELRFYELSPGSNYTGFKAPDSLASNNVYTLPPNGGTTSYVLGLANSVTGELGWMDISTASGVSNTGDVIINADSDSNNTGEVVLQTKGADRVVIDNDGKVGIGTPSPFSTMDIQAPSGDTNIHLGNFDSNNKGYYMRAQVNGNNHPNVGMVVSSGTTLTLKKVASAATFADGSIGLFSQAGALNSANPFWQGWQFGGFDVTEGGTPRYPRASHYWSATNEDDPTDLAYNIGTGNTGTLPADIKIQSSQGGDVILNQGTGNVGIGVLAPNEKLTLEGVLSLREIAAPTANANYGKLYVKTDGKAYFKNDAGTEFDLTDNGDGGTVTSIATGTGLTGGPITTSGTISIAAGGVSSSELASDAVTTVKITDANVTTTKLANNAVTTVKITDANVTTAKLADDAVTSAKLAAGAVDSTALGANSVSSSNIVNGTIVNADISGSAAIDYTKLDIANGEIPQAKVNNLTSSLSSKLPLAGGTMTGNIAMGDNDITGLSSLGLDGATLGTVTVQAPLTVTSYTWQFPSASGSNGQVLMTDGSGATSWTTVNTSSADGHSLDAADGSPANVVYVDNIGEVGVGTTSPTSRLHISGTSPTGGVLVEDSNTSQSSPVVEVRGKRSDSNNSQSFAGGLALAGLRTNAAVGINKSLGNIFFGGNHTNGTESNLAYPASISGIAEGTFSDVNTMPTGLGFFTGSTGRDLGTANQTFGTERMRIDANGNVGIGTSTPNANFHLKGSSWTSSTIEATSNDPVLQLTSDGSSINNDWTMRMDASDSDSLVFRYDNLQRMSLDSSGNLSVSGAISASTINANDSDTLDGLNSTQFLRSDTNDTMNGSLTANNFHTPANEGNGIKFWGGNDAFKIAMGNSAEYQYGPVNSYSIKTFMNGAAGRGWTWGANGATPVAALQNTGNMQIAGDLVVAGGDITGKASDADKLDNLNSTQFLRSDADDTMNGSLTVSGSGTIGGSTWNNGWFKVGNSSSGFSVDPNELYNATSFVIGTLDDTEITVNSSNLNINNGTFSGSTFLYTSDERLKENIQPLENPLERVKKLKGVSFNWKENGKKDIGFIAQQVEANEQELVTTSNNKELGIKDLKAVKYGNITALLVEAIKEIKNQVDSLFDFSDENKREIASLKEENQELKRKLTEQEERLERLEKLIKKK